MNYHGMQPEDHLKFMFNATVEPTGERAYVKEDLMVYHKLNYNEPMPQNMAVRHEHVMGIKMGERDYNNFVNSYGKYLELVYAVEQDPVIKDMFEKMIMYMRLKY